MWSSRRTRKGSPPARLARYQAALLHPFCSRPSAAYSKKPFFSLKKDASVPPLVSLKASPFSSVSLPLQASTNPHPFHYSLLRRSLISTTTMARWWSQPHVHPWCFMEAVPHFKWNALWLSWVVKNKKRRKKRKKKKTLV